MSIFKETCRLLSVSVVLMTTGISVGEEIKFNRDIRPILAKHCLLCHGPDAKHREADLRLDVRASATESAVSAGNPDESELIARVASDDPDIHMPPPKSGDRLSDSEIKLLTDWIRQGAKYQEHWSFMPPRRPKPPPLPHLANAKTNIDLFVLRRLTEEGLSMSRQADRATLIRRASLDLTGLPPSAAKVEAFLQDKSPRAWERVIDRLLASPRYGEHMARFWMDSARYADTNGYQYDLERTQWVWRDWVIDAYNRNMPFDQFTIEQLAGDLLPNATAHQRLATGFNRNHGITIEGGIIDEEYRVEYVMDRLVTVGSVWMGLTIGCARCHQHKYDPITQKEFYEFFAFFNNVPERGMSGFDPRETIASPLAGEQHRAVNQQIADLKAELAKPVDNVLEMERWAKKLASDGSAWSVLEAGFMQSSGGSKFSKLDDQSILVGGANPGKDIYQIHARTDQTGLTAVRLQALTHASLPGGGPGRHTNSNFVLSEFELTVVSAKNPQHSQVVKFSQATAEYSQANYGIEKAIDGTTTNNNGWAVDGPTRKKPVTAIFVAAVPFGYEGGSELQFRLRHEASFGTHGVGRARISVSSAPPASLRFDGPPSDVVRIASLVATKRSAEEQAKLTSYYVAHFGKHKALREQISNLEKKKATSFPATMVMRELAKPRATHILFRGEYDKPREPVLPGTPKILPAFPVGAPRNRLGLAQWLVSPDHPLTSRVTVNRLWQQIFGIGLVKTAEDLGTQGEWPSHPALLDWLAVEFIESGWDVKALLKQILLSATYRQTSIATPQLLQRDPQNRLLARGARFRLDAEVIRDSMLLAAGLLHEQFGGPSVFPYHPKGLWQEINNRPNLSRTYKQDTGNKLYRRSLYTFWKRTVPPPTMAAFDAPEREYCVVRRARTNTPLQALVMLHDPQSIEAARGLATRIMTEASDDIAEQISLGFCISLARKPNTKELQVLIPFYSQQLAEFRKTPQSAVRLLAIGESIPGANLDSAELAAWTTVARVLLNLSEFVTKE